MYTINISLPKILYQKVDKLIAQEGYASRSEFFRTLIRIYSVLKDEKLNLLEFEKKPLTEVEKELIKTNCYNQAFVKSIIYGLKKSSLYANKVVKTLFEKIS